MLGIGSFAICAISLCGVCRWTQQKGRDGALFSCPRGRRLKADEEGLAEKKLLRVHRLPQQLEDRLKKQCADGVSSLINQAKRHREHIPFKLSADSQHQTLRGPNGQIQGATIDARRSSSHRRPKQHQCCWLRIRADQQAKIQANSSSKASSQKWRYGASSGHHCWEIP